MNLNPLIPEKHALARPETRTSGVATSLCRPASHSSRNFAIYPSDTVDRRSTTAPSERDGDSLQMRLGNRVENSFSIGIDRETPSIDDSSNINTRGLHVSESRTSTLYFSGVENYRVSVCQQILERECVDDSVRRTL